MIWHKGWTRAWWSCACMGAFRGQSLKPLQFWSGDQWIGEISRHKAPAVKNKFMKLRSRRVASIGEGGAVGELAVLGDSPYSSVDAVAATTTVRCLVVPVGPKLRALFEEYPKVEVHFLKFILQRATTTITRLNRELRVLAS